MRRPDLAGSDPARQRGWSTRRTSRRSTGSSGSVDVVHGTNFVVPPTRRAGRVVTVHDLTALRYPELCRAGVVGLPSPRRDGLSATAPSCTCPRSFVRDEVAELLGVDPARVRVIPHGSIPGSMASMSWPAAAGRVTAHAPAPYVLALGAVEPRKDLPTLVRAFAELARRPWRSRARRRRARRVGGTRLRRRGRRLGRQPGGSSASATSRKPSGSRCCAAPRLSPSRPCTRASASPRSRRWRRACPWSRRPRAPSRRWSATPPSWCRQVTPRRWQRRSAKVIDDAGVRARLVEAGPSRAAAFTWAAAAASMIELYAAGGVRAAGPLTDHLGIACRRAAAAPRSRRHRDLHPRPAEGARRAARRASAPSSRSSQQAAHRTPRPARGPRPPGRRPRGCRGRS